MALSPTEALAIAPAAQLTDRDRLAIAAAERGIDEMLSTIWFGGGAGFRTAPMHPRAANALQRLYVSRGWDVSLTPLDGRTAKALELMQRGADCEFMVALTPSLEGLRRESVSSYAALVAGTNGVARG